MVKMCITALGIGTVALALSSVDSYAMEKGIITASTLNVRSGPSTNNSIISKINKGQYVEILEKNNVWYKVKLSNGLIGWASGCYIIKADSLNQESSQMQNTTIIIKDKKAKVTATTLNIRSGAGIKYSVIYKANRDIIVDLLEKSSNGWCKVKLLNGVIGWASKNYLAEITNNSSNNNIENNPPIPNDNPLEQKPSTQPNKEDIVSYAYSFLGTPYEWGGVGPSSFDCSGFTKYIYKQIKGKTIPRVSREQAEYGQEVSKDETCPGDLVYFDTDKDGVINHVGIYLGNDEFIHCSGTPSKPDKVKISSLSTDYWSSVLKGARRF